MTELHHYEPTASGFYFSILKEETFDVTREDVIDFIISYEWWQNSSNISVEQAAFLLEASTFDYLKLYAEWNTKAKR